MTNTDAKDYDDVPGTYVLDSRSYRKGYKLNMFLMSLNKADCRAEFAKDEAGYMDTFGVNEDQKDRL